MFCHSLTHKHSAPTPDQVEAAKKLCESLVDNIKEKYVEFKEGRIAQEAMQGGDQESRYRRGQESHHRGGRGGRDHGHERGHGRGKRDWLTGEWIPAMRNENEYTSGGLNYDNVASEVDAPASHGAGGTSGQASYEYADKGTYGAAYSPYAHTGIPAATAAATPVTATAQAAAAAQTGQDLSIAQVAMAAGMDVTTYQAWAQYYIDNPHLDQYAAHGGFQAYMQQLASFHAQGLGAVHTPGPDPSQSYGQGYSMPTQDHSGYAQSYSAGGASQAYGYSAPGSSSTPGAAAAYPVSAD